MSGSLRCFSFHSVKGGVGKSTLATACACYLSTSHAQPIYLIDMDLTGTSLADVLPLQAPAWPTADSEPLDLVGGPKQNHFHPRNETRQRMNLRWQSKVEPAKAYGVPFLNDFL